MIEATTGDVARRGEGYWLSLAAFAKALFNIGIGNHRAALGPAVSAEDTPDLVAVALGRSRTRRSGCSQWRDGHRDRRLGSAHRNDQCLWHRLGARR